VIRATTADVLYRSCTWRRPFVFFFFFFFFSRGFLYDRQGKSWQKTAATTPRAKSRSEMFSYEQVEALVQELLKEPSTPTE